jgi:hypothetical protein
MHGTLPAGDASIERNARESFRPAAVSGLAGADDGAECQCLARFRDDWLRRVEASGLAAGEGDDADWLAARGAATLPTMPGRVATCSAGSRCRLPATSPGVVS